MRALDDLLRQAAAVQRLAVERGLAPFDLTPAQFAAMELLEQAPGLSGAELARRERQAPATTSVVIGNLQRKGFVIRSARAQGGRAQRLELTEAGRERVRAAANAIGPLRDRLCGELDPAFQMALKHWLRRVVELDL